jgi:hypothetical protein
MDGGRCSALAIAVASGVGECRSLGDQQISVRAGVTMSEGSKHWLQGQDNQRFGPTSAESKRLESCPGAMMLVRLNPSSPDRDVKLTRRNRHEPLVSHDRLLRSGRISKQPQLLEAAKSEKWHIAANEGGVRVL